YIIFLDKATNFFSNVVGSIFSKDARNNIKSSFKLVPWQFGISLLIGMFLASVLFSNLITYLLEDNARYVYALFFGLVAGSIFVPLKEIGKIQPVHLVIIILTTVILFIIFGIKPTSYGTNPPEVLLFAAGVIAVVGNVLPGVSGPFLLLLVGLYDFIISLLASVTTLQFDLEQIKKFTFFFTGQLVGLAVFIKILTYLLKKFPKTLMSILVGVIAASLRITYPFFTGTPDNKTVISPFSLPTQELVAMVLLIFLGLFIVYLAGKLGADRKQVRKIEKS
ncbi:DUF368 domain-containing protein, partial [Candidatus Dojkabacteria bacterium]|nr:DUF368 domain-containing protein [Candidatus Dojkabacteria bacterium]